MYGVSVMWLKIAIALILVALSGCVGGSEIDKCNAGYSVSVDDYRDSKRHTASVGCSWDMKP